jgi:hypothetical protein
MNFINHAEELALEGFNPLPLKKDKAPMLPVGHPFLYESIDRIESRFSHAEGIGIACGKVSGGFYAIDFDCHQGQDIETVFMSFYENQFIQYLLSIDQIIFYKTPSGGFHGYIKTNEIHKGKVICKYLDGHTMIEMRGNGQYVATYPTKGYQYLAGCDMVKLQYMDHETFNNIMTLVMSYDLNPEVNPNSSEPSRSWPEQWDNNSITGNFNNNQADFAKTLLTEAGWKFKNKRRHDGVELWQRPGKDDDSISATFGAKYNMFYVFTSNAKPFKENTAYNPFSIYTLLKFNGEWRAAKDSLKPEIEIKVEPDHLHEFFPIDVFPKFLQDYIMELKRTLNFHPDFSAAAAMYAISTMNGNKFKLRVKNGWEAQTIFWFACVGYPGTIKTHPVKTMINPLYDIDRMSKKQYDSDMEHWDPEAKPKKPKPKFKQLLISDYTIEALHAIHDYNKRGIGLYKDELVGFLNDMNKYRKGSDEQFWLESFNNGTYTVNRATKEPLMIENICINIIGTIQHDVLNKIINEYKGNGLIDRFLFTASENHVYPLNNEEMDMAFGEYWTKIVQKMNRDWLYFDRETTEIIKMTPEAFAVYQQIDQDYVNLQMSDEIGQEQKNYLSKMKTYVPRFALLLAVMESVFENSYIIVNDSHMINAGRIGQYFIKTAKSVFESNVEQLDIKSIDLTLRGQKRDDRIRAIYEKGFGAQELAKYFSLSKTHIYRILKKDK